MSAAFIAWLLGLSLVSDFIKKHSIHLENRKPISFPRWISWGTRERGDLLADGHGGVVQETPGFFILRIPGWYWEEIYSINTDESKSGWCRRYVVYIEPSRVRKSHPEGWFVHHTLIDA